MYTHPQTRKLGELLRQRQLISARQLQHAIALQAETRRPLGEILIQQQIITERQLKRALKWQQILRAAMLVSSFTLASSPSMASEAQRLTKQLVDNLASFSQASNNLKAKNRTSQADPAWLARLRSGPAAPIVALATGQYAGGVSQSAQGLRYKAKWSEDSVKLELHYQF